MAKPIEMPFGLWTRVGPRKHVLHGGAHWRNLANTTEPPMFGVSAKRRSDRNAVWVVDSGGPKEACEVHNDATWQIPLNRPRAAAMQPFYRQHCAKRKSAGI